MSGAEPSVNPPARADLRIGWATWWGVLGFAALLIQALCRLAPLAWEPIQSGTLADWHWGLLGVSVAFNAYTEGYRGFQKQAAPRVVARALYLGRGGERWHRLLAPLFCMSLFHTTKKRLVVSWCLYLGIIVLIVLVRQLSQPWRGIVDAGVVIGLGWGLMAVLGFFLRALAGTPPPASPELPSGT